MLNIWFELYPACYFLRAELSDRSICWPYHSACLVKSTYMDHMQSREFFDHTMLFLYNKLQKYGLMCVIWLDGKNAKNDLMDVIWLDGINTYILVEARRDGSWRPAHKMTRPRPPSSIKLLNLIYSDLSVNSGYLIRWLWLLPKPFFAIPMLNQKMWGSAQDSQVFDTLLVGHKRGHFIGKYGVILGEMVWLFLLHVGLQILHQRSSKFKINLC